MPVNCGQVSQDEVALAKEVVRSLGASGSMPETVVNINRRDLQRRTSGWRSVEGELMETALVRMTMGQSRDLANQINAFYTAVKVLRMQAQHIVANALNVHATWGHIRRRIGLDSTDEAAIRSVERAARDITGQKDLEFVRHLDPQTVRRLDEQFDTHGGDAGAAFPRDPENQLAREFVAAVQRVTGYEYGEALRLAAMLWKQHGDMFATGVTRKGTKIQIGEESRLTSEVARAVLEELPWKDNDAATSLTRWLSRASELKAEHVAFPGGQKTAINAVLEAPAPDVARKVTNLVDQIDRESWNPRYAEKTHWGAAGITMLFLGGLKTGLVQLGAMVTAAADLGLATYITGALSVLTRFPLLLGRVDPTSARDIAVANAVREGSGGPGAVTTPVLVAMDRITRLANAEAAVHHFKEILSDLRSKYSGWDELPPAGEDANIDRLRFVGFTEEHIRAAINSKQEMPVLPLAYYTARATDIGTGTPSAMSRPPFTREVWHKVINPFSSFAIRMGQNVFRRLYREPALRNWMEAKTMKSLSVEDHARAVAIGWRDRVKAVRDIDFRYVLMLLGGSMTYDHFIISPVEEAIGVNRDDDKSSLERAQQNLVKMFEQGYITPEEFTDNVAAAMQSLQEVGALGLVFDLYEKQFAAETGVPLPQWVKDSVGRSPVVKTAGAVWEFGHFAYAAGKNADAVNSEEFYLRVARDMGFVGDDPTLTGMTQYQAVESLLGELDTPEQRKVILDYLREQTAGRVMAQFYSFPLVRNDYLLAMMVDSEHHNRLLVETLMRARNLGGFSEAGATVRLPSESGVPPLSQRWESRSAHVKIIEATLMARYNAATPQELYDKVIMPEHRKRQLGQNIVQESRQPTKAVVGDETVLPSGN